MIIILILAVGTILTWPIFAKAALKTAQAEFSGVPTDATDYFMAILLGFMLAMMWPITLIGLWVYKKIKE